MQNPCTQDCPKRHATCRLTCPEGRAYFAERRAKYEEREKEYQNKHAIEDYRSREFERNLRKRKVRYVRHRRKN